MKTAGEKDVERPQTEMKLLQDTASLRDFLIHHLNADSTSGRTLLYVTRRRRKRSFESFGGAAVCRAQREWQQDFFATEMATEMATTSSILCLRPANRRRWRRMAQMAQNAQRGGQRKISREKFGRNAQRTEYKGDGGADEGTAMNGASDTVNACLRARFWHDLQTQRWTSALL